MRATAERAGAAHHPRYRRHVDLLRVASAACPG
ncbi:putative leader peptide [Pseudonocardia sp. HH130630-07]